MLARELLSKPDGFLTATIGEEEYVIDGFKRTKTHANLDNYSHNPTRSLA